MTLLYVKRARELNKLVHIISTDEHPGLRIERGVSTNKIIICFIAMQTYKSLVSIQLHGDLKLSLK
jgi:hypothetical protein